MTAWTPVVGIISILILMILAILNGIDGMLMTAAIGSIAAISTWALKGQVDKRRQKKQ